MSHPQTFAAPAWAHRLQMRNFTYTLPQQHIALHPLPERDASRLLEYRSGEITHRVFRQLGQCLQPQTLLVFNETKVIPARLEFFRETGARIELFCLEPLHPSPEVATALTAPQTCTWLCLVGNLKKWQPQEILGMQLHSGGEVWAEQLERRPDGVVVRFSWQPAQLAFAQVLQQVGQVPLPPYLKRDAVAEDHQRYQTVYARAEGSVAAPTAGLHFTEGLLAQLAQQGIRTQQVTLHVGAGTFKPVQADSPAGHDMHHEEVHVHSATVRSLAQQKQSQQPVVAVGTTSLRTLESLYIWGARCLHSPGVPLHTPIAQWEPYQPQLQGPTAAEALTALANRMDAELGGTLSSETGLILLPGYDFKVADGLITNFHQPDSTLLLLVAAFIGPHWQQVYQTALAEGYRFLSYGDSSLLWRNPEAPGLFTQPLASKA